MPLNKKNKKKTLTQQLIENTYTIEEEEPTELQGTVRPARVYYPLEINSRDG